jgi:NAD(P)-dependent dehydrogenase (short-subunit alcohol dehydrogenase family)
MSLRHEGHRPQRHSQPFPPQREPRPPEPEHDLHAEPEIIREGYIGSERLAGRNALITGGDSGIGRAVAVHFAAEGAAAVGIVYLDERRDAEKTAALVEACDVRDAECAEEALEVFRKAAGRQVHVLVNNAAGQRLSNDAGKIGLEQLAETFRTNVYSYFLFTHAALPHMPDGAAIVNTTSWTTYRGNPNVVDSSAATAGATKGAIVAFTRSLAAQLTGRRIRVNAVAPGPMWTPLDAEGVAQLGKRTLMQRAGQPSEVAPSYVFLASADASYMTGQVLHPNGGEFTSPGLMSPDFVST